MIGFLLLVDFGGVASTCVATVKASSL